MDAQRVKFEHSPADSLDSFVSTPGSQYPLFPQSSDMADMEADAMTPPFDDDSMFDQSMSGSMAGDMEGDMDGTPAPDKKPVKKRKSWGQQLPEPKTNLPPRKRAKTEDEKEQRRVERVLRNRRAAQSSRERKRQEVEALEAEKRTIERRNQDLEMRLADSEAKRIVLEQQIAQITGGMTVFNQTSSPSSQTEPYRQAPSPITFSQELFSSRDGNSYQQPAAEAHRNLQSSIQTVDPASLSPEIHPVVESTSNASSSDMTQHPAAVLCDLQCQSEEQRPWMNSTKANSSISAITTWLLLISTTSTFLQPLSAILNSLRTGSSLSPIPSVLNMIIWLVSTPTALTTSTSTTSSTTTTTAHTRQPRLSLRMNMLRRLLACSPQLARPLMDATMGVMRSASEQQLLARAFLGSVPVSRPNSETDPSMESLMTLLWTTQVIDRERQRQDEAMREPEQVDVVTQVRLACEELDELFRQRSEEGVGIEPPFPCIEGEENQKSTLDGTWRLAFQHR